MTFAGKHDGKITYAIEKRGYIIKFVKVPNSLIYEKARHLTPNAFLIYLVLLDKRREKLQYAFCSDKTLSEWTGITRSNIFRYRDELIKKGLVVYYPQGYLMAGYYDEGIYHDEYDFPKIKSRYVLICLPGYTKFTCVPKDEILYNKDLTAKEKLIYTIYLATFNEKLGYAYPSIENIAEWAGISCRTVTTTNKGLAEKGYIEIIKKKYRRSRFSNNCYIPKYRIQPTGEKAYKKKRWVFLY